MRRLCNVKSVKCKVIMAIIFYFALHITHYTLRSLFAQDKIAAIVNNDVITDKDLNDFINFMRVDLRSGYTPEQLENKIQAMKPDLLDRLIEDKLILQEAKKSGMNVEESRIKAKIDQIKKRYDSDSDFQGALKLQGLVQSDIEAKIREQVLMYSIIEFKIRSKIIITPAEVTVFYQSHSSEFKSEEQRSFETITIENEAVGREICDYWRQKADIQDLAGKYSFSVNKLTAVKSGQLKKDIEAVVFSLKTGEISPPLKSGDIYYIFRLDNIIPSRQQNLVEVRDSIYSHLFDKKMQEEMDKWLDSLKKQSYIKIFQE
ncbi:MAG: peptidyl-prolyl cis-trans isomerase [Candidatus Omnitrophota bacterium]